MPVLHSFDYPPNDGGIARLCSEIANSLRAAGAEIRVLTQEGRDGNAARSHTFEVRLGSRRPWREWQAYRWLRRNGPGSTVICGIWYPEGFLAARAGMRPLVILAHGSELMPSAARWRRSLWKAMLDRTCHSADLVVANSEYTRRLVLANAPRAKVVAIPLAVDHLRFSPGSKKQARRRLDIPEKVVISSVSRLHAYKGHETVLRALATLPVDARRHLLYLVAGTGPHESVLRTQADQLGLHSNVRWLGFVPEADLPEVYRASDLFVLCTREAPAQQQVEGFGLVFLEAQACGTPVVGTRTGGIPDAIRHGDGGWLIGEDDVEQLRQILINAIEEPTAFSAAGAAGRLRVERECTWSHYQKRFTAALNSEGISLG